MGSAYIEVGEQVTAHTVERAHRAMHIAQRMDLQRWADVGWRAAAARDPLLLKVMEQAVGVLHRMHEEQHGRHQRAPGTVYRETSDLTEYASWREAYRLADQGQPERALMWVYGAGAALAGIQGFPPGA